MASEASQDIFLSIVFPAFNEADRLPGSLHRTIAYLRQQDYTWEIIVVDDGSADTTTTDAKAIFEQELVPGCVLSLPTNQGKGAAVKQGFQAARGQILFFSDADMATPIEDLDKLLPFFDQGFDIVIGSRAQPSSHMAKRQPIYRETAGRIFNVMVQCMVFRGIKDTQCGFKGFRAQAIPVLLDHQRISGFAFDVELLWLARKFGMNICEVPVNWRHVEESKVGLFKDSLRMFLDLFRIRWMHRRSKMRNASQSNGIQ